MKLGEYISTFYEYNIKGVNLIDKQGDLIASTKTFKSRMKYMDCKVIPDKTSFNGFKDGDIYLSVQIDYKEQAAG